jgi:pilus assembly protein CpaE
VNSRGLQVYAALENGLGLDAIRAALPLGTPVRTVALGEAGRAGSEIQPGADLIIVGCSDAQEQALGVISAAIGQRSDRPVVVLYQGSPNGFLERAFEAGADDLVSLPHGAEQLGFALEKALARRRGSLSAATEGSLITVLGPKGGTGKTVTSSNLAVALALAGRSAVLVDLDLQFGDVGLALGLQPTRTIYDLARSGGSLDGEKIDGFLAEHPSGARALLAPLRPDQAAAVGTAFLREVLEILRTRYDFVLVDTPPAFTPEVIAAVDASSHLCVVGMLDALSLKDTKIGLETLEEMGYDPAAVTLVLNRADSNVGITPGDVEELLGRAPDVLVGSDRAIPRALTNGQPIVVAEPKSKAARSYAALAERYLAATGRLAPGVAALADAASDHGDKRRRTLLRKAS